jgi:hypothetical protein
LLPAAFASLLLISAACADSLRFTGATPALAVDHSAGLFSAIANRFDKPIFSPDYLEARRDLAGSALVPSRIFDDSSLWSTMPSSSTRWLYLAGSYANGHYRLGERRSLPTPIAPADTRHAVGLEQLSPSVYRWTTNVDMAIGSISAADVSMLIHGLLGAADGRTERDARADFASAFPRAAAAFGRGFRVDSLRLSGGSDGTTAVALTLGFDPDLMKRSFPKLAKYLDRYLGPAKYTFVLSDRAGARLFTVSGRDRQVTIRYRLRHGALVALTGPPRAWGDTLVLTSDLSLKVKLFTVGFRHLVTDFIINDAGHDRSWTVVAQHEPEWDLPLFTERLIRSPLRQPFEGAGARMEFFIRDSSGAQTLFGHQIRLDVRESAIVRFIGSLAAHAVNDLDTDVEAEEDRFLHEGFAALAADTRALPR